MDQRPSPLELKLTLAHINQLTALARHDGFREMRGDETLEQYERALAQWISVHSER